MEPLEKDEEPPEEERPETLPQQALGLPRDARVIANGILVLGVALITGGVMRWFASGSISGPIWIPLMVCYAGWGLLHRYRSGRHWAIGVAVMLFIWLPVGAVFLLAIGGDWVAGWMGKPPKIPMTINEWLLLLSAFVVGAVGAWGLRVLCRADTKAACSGEDPERIKWRFGVMDWFRVSVGVAVGLSVYAALVDQGEAGPVPGKTPPTATQGP